MNAEPQLNFCSNCQYGVPNDQEYKAHYKSDFHRYNIRRRLLNLAPVSFDVFQQKFLESQSNTSCSSSQQQHYYCASCKKPFYSQGTYNQHINSQKHKQILKEQLKGGNTKKEQQEKLKHICFFCENSYNSLEEQLQHMIEGHGFFIREKENLEDLDGLMAHLQKILEQNECLYCGAIFQNTESTKQHMIDKGHCFMPEEEYGELCHYYDYQRKIQQLLDEEQTIIEVEDELEDDFEIISLQSVHSEFIRIELTEEQQKRKTQFRILLQKLEQIKAKLLPNGEIQLPNGKMYFITDKNRIGNRIYKKYYDQCHVVKLEEKNHKQGMLQNYEMKSLQSVHYQQQQHLNLGLNANITARKHMRKRE